MTPPPRMTIEARAYRLGNDLANAKHYLARGRQFNDKYDLPILIAHISAAQEEARAEGYETAKKSDHCCCDETKECLRDSYAQGFSDGQERMRERIANVIHGYVFDEVAWMDIEKDIRSLPLDVPLSHTDEELK